MRRFNNNNPFGDSDSDNDMAPPQSQASNGNNNNPFAQPVRGNTNPFSGSNPFDSDDDAGEPPKLNSTTPDKEKLSDPLHRTSSQPLPSSVSSFKPPKSQSSKHRRNNSSEVDTVSKGGISSWFTKAGSSFGATPESSQHGSTASLPSKGSSGNLSKIVSNRLGDVGSSSATNANANSFPSTKKKTKTRKVKSKSRRPKIQQWPYDDYHKEQQKYYAKMGDTDSLSDVSSQLEMNAPERQNSKFSSFMSPRNQSISTPSQSRNPISHLYERPPELPSIKETVQDLPLLEFEKVAEQRAIHIVSTFLFDSGLIDELLVNGGMTYKKSSMPTLAPRSDASINHSGNASVGVEVGMNGFPIGENAGVGVKIEKEINRLRSNTQNQLAKINHRLNDGVATSGAEVQELVNAVVATKGDLGRLKELSTYANSAKQNDFILSNYPKLKSAMNARRNLFRCFRELDFFSQIPSTCDRLREEMHSGEWTKDEWEKIRSVCMEHVELQILLIEAESGMKARLKSDTENGVSQDPYDAVDKFLSTHVKNVWELGEEIKMRVLSGIGNAFEIALNNPAGMVALCEAVEVYERAELQYKSSHRDSSETLHFTNIRSDALSQLYQDFELRGVSVFREIHMESADIADEKESMNQQFSSILHGATQLVVEIDLVKNQMAPCFPPHWAVEILWASCVAHVCSNQILQQIGGQEGSNLVSLTVTQLLDLIAWIEIFRDHIEKSFPQVAGMKSTQKTYLDSRPDIFTADKKEVDMDSATDSVAWAKNTLWEVNRLAQDEFLIRTRKQTDELLGNVYKAEHEEHQAPDGKLASSLCEDVFSLVGVQLRTLRDHLSSTSDALVFAVCLIFSHLQAKQIQSRDNFLKDLESCCASVNDFSRMSEKCDEVLTELLEKTELSKESQETLRESSSELTALYSFDAAFAAQKTHLYIFEPIEEEIADQFFTTEWENNLASNELASMLVKTLEDFMQDLERYMDGFFVKKAVEALVTATATFYIKCLLVRAEHHSSHRNPAFEDVAKALDRFKGDVAIFRAYFETLVSRNPVLKRIIQREFEIVTTVHEVMYIAAGLHEGDASDFVLIIHKKIGDVNTTKHFFADLWHLVNPREERTVIDLIEQMEGDLCAIVPPKTDSEIDRNEVPGLKLASMLKPLYEKSQRKLPGKGFLSK